MDDDNENSRIVKLLFSTDNVLQSTKEMQSKLQMADVVYMLDRLEEVVQILKEGQPDHHRYQLSRKP